MWLYNGKEIKKGKGWSDSEGTQHPANWDAWSTEEKLSRGLVWQDDPEPYDDRFYWSAGVPKDLDMLKAEAISTCKEHAAGLLRSSDWYVVRYAETGTAIPQTVLDYRQAVRQSSNSIEADINACLTHDEFMALYDIPVDAEGNPIGQAPISSWPDQ